MNERFVGAQYAASVILAQLPFPKTETQAVLDQFGPIGELNGIALFDFFGVRDELRRRNGIQASYDDDAEVEVEVIADESDEMDPVEVQANIDQITADAVVNLRARIDEYLDSIGE